MSINKPKLSYAWTRWGSREGSIAAVPGGELRVFVGERSGLDEWEVVLDPHGPLSFEHVAFGSGRSIDNARAQAEEAYKREFANRNL